MPHSSGGGSSSGGSHSSGGSSSGGSYSSGGGSSRTGVRLYNHYSPGKHVFVRYQDGTPTYYYSDYSYKRTVQADPASKVLMICLCIFFVLAGLVCFISSDITPPSKVTTGETACTILDDAGCFTASGQNDIVDAVGEFYEKTGIPVTIHTIGEQTFLDADKDDLETYAYYDYVNQFDDEDHWLIVFEDIDSEARKWAFEGMQGDNTDHWLSDEVTSAFNQDLTEALWNENNSYASSFAFAFRSLTTRCGMPNGNGIITGILAVIVGFCFLIPLKIIESSNKKTLEGFHEVTIPQENQKTGPKLVKCDYCGSTYVYGETQCPHCGAPGKVSSN